MREAQVREAEKGLNGVAKKVYQAVPITEPWSRAQIVAELRRGGNTCDAAVVGGCLDTLRGRGLVREPTRGMFVRVQARQWAASPPCDEESGVDAAVKKVDPPRAATPPVTPLDRLAAMAASMRQQAQALGQLAAQVEEIALDVQAQVENERAGGERLRQLAALLKDIG